MSVVPLDKVSSLVTQLIDTIEASYDHDEETGYRTNSDPPIDVHDFANHVLALEPLIAEIARDL